MHALFSNSLAALLLLHAVLGCCWHHAHAAVAAPHSSAIAACCHEHEHASPCEHESPAPCPCGEECDVTCAYLPTQKTQLDAAGDSLPFALLALHPVATAAEFAAASVDGVGLCTIAVEPPVRLHLAHHVLLI